MIIIDTNVLSELMRPIPADAVLSWISAQAIDDLWTTTITEAELLVGVVTLPDGRRKSDLARAIDTTIARFGQRILPFDRDAAQQLPNVFLQRRGAKLEMKWADGQIAAIAHAYGADVATRDVDDFTHTGIKVINPWTAQP
jgi:toxin FitB